MIKILKNKNNKSLIEFNLFNNPFYRLYDKKCSHYSTYIEDFKNGKCRFCENLPLIEGGPSEKRMKPTKEIGVGFKNMKKQFSWKKSKNKDAILYTLYKVNLMKDMEEEIKLLFVDLCRNEINPDYIIKSSKNLDNEFIIVTALYPKSKYEEIVGFSIYMNNYSYINVKNYKYKNEDLNTFIEYKIKEDYPLDDEFLPIIIKLFSKSSIVEDIFMSNKIDSINKTFKQDILNDKYSFSKIYNTIKEIEIFKRDSYPEMYIDLICSSERHKANIGTAMIYFLQNEIKEKIKESNSIEGYICLDAISDAKEFYNYLGFYEYSEMNNIFYENINTLMKRDILKIDSSKLHTKSNTFMVSPNLAEKDLHVEKIKDFIIKE